MKKRFLLFVAFILLTGSLIFSQDNSIFEDWIKFDLNKTGNGEWKAKIDTKENELKVLNIYPEVGYVKYKGKVLFIMNQQASWSDTCIKKILDVYSDKGFYPDITIAHYEKDNEKLLRALKKANDEYYNLIFTVGSSVLKDVYDNYKGKRIPVVSACNKDPVLLGYAKDYEKGSGNNFAYTSVNTPIDVQVTFLKKLKKDLKNVAILVARSNSSAMKTQYEPLKKALQKENINVIDVILGPDTKTDNIEQTVKSELYSAIPNAVAQMRKSDPKGINSIFWLTYSTSVVKNLETINRYSKKIPVVGVATDTVKEGLDSAVIGIGVSFESNAYKAAIYGMDILTKKEKVGELKVGLISPPDIAISFKIAKAIGLKIPFSFFESANIIYDYDGVKVRDKGQKVIK